MKKQRHRFDKQEASNNHHAYKLSIGHNLD